MNIEVGTKWNSLNIQNKQLNSIFAKVDNGDKEVSNDELTLLQKLFKKADEIINATSKNNILEVMLLIPTSLMIIQNIFAKPLMKLIKRNKEKNNSRKIYKMLTNSDKNY